MEEYSLTQQSIGTALQSIAANKSVIGPQPARAVNILEEKYGDDIGGGVLYSDVTMM